MRKRSFLDLPAAKLEELEDELGPVDTWSGIGKVRLSRYVLAAFEGVTAEDIAARGYTSRELFDAVDLEASEPDPTPPGDAT